MEKIISLFERLVIALEKIAENNRTLGPSVTYPPNQEPFIPTTIKELSEQLNDPMTMPRDYDAISQQKDGRKVLVQLCEKRGIEVKPRSKNSTLVKDLKKWDLANPHGEVVEPREPEVVEPPVKESSPFVQTEPDPNPFGVSEPSKKEYTAAEVQNAARKYLMENYPNKDQQAEGTAFLKKLLMDIAETEIFNEVPKEKYPALMAELGE